MKNLFILLVIIFSFITTYSTAQTQLKIMSYNLLKYPNGVSGINRKNDLRYILNEAQPDILMVCELQDEQGSNEILNYCLSTPDNRYSGATFEYNHSGIYRDLQQMIYYNNQKFQLINSDYVTTYLRDINHYTLKLLTVDADTNPVFFDFYVAHLKSSQGSYNENKRLDMVNDFVNDLNNVPQDHYVIFAGDFNLYRSTEPAFQKIIDPNNHIIMKDPLGCSATNNCFWHNNTTYAQFDTQSTHTQSVSSYVGGGLNDRFDFIMLSENLFSNNSVQYQNNSNTAFGNNGDCFNNNINDTDCSGSFDMTLRQHLYNMSDHLPDTLILETNLTLSNQEISNLDVRINEALPVNNQISFSGDFENIDKVIIYDTTGKQIYIKQNYFKNEIIDLQKIKNGIYFVELKMNEKLKIIKFAKSV